MQRDPPRLRIGFSSASPIGTDVHPEAVAAVNDAAKLLASLGHDVEEAAPEIDGASLAKAFLHVYFGQVPAMVAQSYGKIVSFSGGGAAYARPFYTAYGSSKAALVRLTESLAEELRNSHIDVNIIAPGPVCTAWSR